MPFTAAHTVAAVPVARVLGGRAVMSALVVGSMTPDLAYFLPFDVARWQSHSLPALLWFCLPVGLSVWAFFHLCVAPLVHDVSPEIVRDRLPRVWARGALPDVRFVDVALCIVLGAMTHLFWDSFTHRQTPLTAGIPAMGRTLVYFEGYAFSPVRVLQHTSTLFGLTLLAVWARRWLLAPVAGDEPHPAPNWAIRIILVAAVMLPAIWLGAEAAVERWGWSLGVLAQMRQSLTGIVFVGGVAWCWSLVLVAVGWRLLRTRAVSRSSSSSPPQTAPPAPR